MALKLHAAGTCVACGGPACCLFKASLHGYMHNDTRKKQEMRIATYASNACRATTLTLRVYPTSFGAHSEQYTYSKYNSSRWYVCNGHSENKNTKIVVRSTQDPLSLFNRPCPWRNRQGAVTAESRRPQEVEAAQTRGGVMVCDSLPNHT